MYLNTVFKYNVFKYCPALSVGNISLAQIMYQKSTKNRIE